MVYKIILNNKRVFMETFILTLSVLLVGFFIGYFIEAYRVNKIVEDYRNFEISASDLRLQNYYYQIMSQTSCEKAIRQNFIFADNIYDQGLLIEKYEEANEISDEILLEKKKYILLKTELWLNSILLKEKCNNPFHTVVYVYSQEANEIKRAEQSAISNILRRLKEEEGNQIILLPIAGDMGLEIVNLQLDIYSVNYLPSIIVDEKYVLDGFHELEEIKSYLGKNAKNNSNTLVLN